MLLNEVARFCAMLELGCVQKTETTSIKSRFGFHIFNLDNLQKNMIIR